MVVVAVAVVAVVVTFLVVETVASNFDSQQPQWY